MISLESVTFSYDGITALHDVSLSVAKGEAVSLMGVSGCGKSTLLRMINGIVLPSSGSYRFDGEEITRKKMDDRLFAKAFHKRIGFVFQNAEVQLFCATVFDEVAFGPRQMALSEGDVAERVGDSLSLLEIDHLAGRQPFHLSGGEKRKVAIASVLALNPEVLTLDEPLTGLDPRTQRWFVDLIVKLNRSGKTVITSSHNLDLAQEFLEHYLITPQGLDAMDRHVPLGVPALIDAYNAKAADSLIAGSMKNIEVGTLMPNIPQMGVFWSAMESALATITAGRSTPRDALDNARQRMLRKP